VFTQFTMSSSTNSTMSNSSSSSSTSSSVSVSSSSSSSSTTSDSSSSSSSSTSTTAPPPTSSSPPSSTPPPSSSVKTFTPTDSNGSTHTVTSTQTQAPVSNTASSTSSSASSTSGASIISGSKSTTSHGLGTGGTIAVAVVVPIVAVALIVLAGIFFWRKRKARKDAEELRRKEVEEYGYNPNNDPTLPGVVAGGSDGPFEMREDGSSGYRGWGTTAVASSGRKASTTLSGGQSAGGIGMAYSEGTSPTHGPVSDTRSDNPLVDGNGRPLSGETEVLGALGPAAAGNRTGDINRGPSNASSSYSAANRSDGSGDAPVAGGAYYNNQYDTGNPYSDGQYGSPPQGRAEMSGQPVIRDVQARRNTRIENPSHFPQQSAGISQNF